MRGSILCLFRNLVLGKSLCNQLTNCVECAPPSYGRYHGKWRRWRQTPWEQSRRTIRDRARWLTGRTRSDRTSPHLEWLKEHRWLHPAKIRKMMKSEQHGNWGQTMVAQSTAEPVHQLTWPSVMCLTLIFRNRSKGRTCLGWVMAWLGEWTLSGCPGFGNARRTPATWAGHSFKTKLQVP